jgi:serine/threonine protein kinase
MFMAWPTSQDYNEAIQDPASCFSESDLWQGAVVVNALGLPQPCSGSFADVYAIQCRHTGRKWAVKCFTREVPGLRKRYRQISRHLRRARLKFTVDFRYREQGIRVHGQWYPILKMDWIEGFPLNTFVRDSLDKPEKLDRLSKIWLRMARRLREVQATHGDLQHGNILLVPDFAAQSVAVKLIDYDGMWVPALANCPSGEVGHPAYQHPQRLREGTYGPEVDRFSLLVIYCAIRSLRFGGRSLWERFDTGDNLLFGPQDFAAPTRSPLFAELLRMNQPEVRELAGTLIDATRMPLEQTPLLMEIEDEKPPAAVTTLLKGPARQTAIAGTDSPAGQPITPNGSKDRALEVRGLLLGGVIGATIVFLCFLGITALFWTVFRRPHEPSTAGPGLPQRNALVPSAEDPVQLTAAASKAAPKGASENPLDLTPKTEPSRKEEEDGRFVNSIGMQFVYVRAGKVMMNQAGAPREVMIREPFFLSIHSTFAGLPELKNRHSSVCKG